MQAERAALGAHLAARVDALVEAWQAAIAADPTLTTGDALPRAQLVDHLPQWLLTLARALAAVPGPAADRQADIEETRDAEAHGLQRWQQGYDLHEVTREWGAIHLCLVDELNRYCAAVPVHADVQAQARLVVARFVSDATSDSAAQYFHLARLEAAGGLLDLEEALDDIRALEQSRAELWQQAAHDLRGNLGVVANVAHGLTLSELEPQRRQDFLGRLRNNIRSLHRLLDDVTDLARLHAGQELRRDAPFDAGAVLQGLCDDVQPLAEERRLRLVASGPVPLAVEGDAVKVRRIAQNLLLNALKYTVSGGVVVSWGETAAGDDGRWWLQVADTGPGFHAGPAAPLMEALGTTPGEPAAVDDRPIHHTHGEGLGLAIVKRLCELLGASLEVQSVPERGTTVRVLVPLRYGARTV